jgi:Flp pilus assembly protein TadB
MDCSQSDHVLMLSRVKESPDMFGRGEDSIVENQDGSGSKSHNSREKESEVNVTAVESTGAASEPLEGGSSWKSRVTGAWSKLCGALHSEGNNDAGVIDGGETGEREQGGSKKPLNQLWRILAWVVIIILCVPVVGCLWILRSRDSSNRELDDRFKSADHRIRQEKAEKVLKLKKDRRTRLTAAIIGGLALVGPMLIMAINPSLKKNLITVSCCVFTFAILMALKSPAEPGDLLASTAGYAAVLVVFTTGLH